MIDLDEIRKLSVAERLQLVEDIWDTIPPEDMPITDEVKAELDRRESLYEQDPQSRPLNEVLERLRHLP